MVNDQRLAFSRKWWQRTNCDDDPFDRFFCLWISLIVAARRKVDEESLQPERETDSGLVKAYFMANCAEVVSVLQRQLEVLARVAEQRCPRGGGTGELASTRSVRPGIRRLAIELLSKDRPPDSELASRAAELVNRARNNLFHGRKLYDDREDLELLEAVNPIVSDILAICERFID